MTLFEVAHGYYPAAYISIGTTVRAADALEIHPGTDASPLLSIDDLAKREDTVFTWCGILILDRYFPYDRVPRLESFGVIYSLSSRYIAVESGPHPSLTRSRFQSLLDILKPTICPTHQHDQDRTSSICRLARLFEASSLLDQSHTTTNIPTTEHANNLEELGMTVQTLINLRTILNEEIGDGIHLYASGLSLCNM